MGDVGSKLVDALMSFMDTILAGKVPASFCPILFGASLTAIRKKTGGIRPIAVGNVWRRLAAKIVIGRITPDLVELFSPDQLGVGIKGGAEAEAHAGRIYFNAQHESPRAFLKMDFRNAFNEIRRDKLLDVVKASFPSILPFVSQCYRSNSQLYFGTNLIQSALGQLNKEIHFAQHYLPLSFTPLFPPSRLSSMFGIWTMGRLLILLTLKAFQTVVEMGREVGLTLNPAKCEVAVVGSQDESEIEETFKKFDAIAPGIQRIHDESATLLGSPLTGPATEPVLDDKTAALEFLSTRLSHLTSHSAFFLLRASVSIPRLIYFLRCAPSWKKRAHLQRYDNVLRKALVQILNCAISDESWIQLSFPVNLGGFEVRHAVDSAIPCFIASFHSVLPLISLLLPVGFLESDQTLEEAMLHRDLESEGHERPPEEFLCSQSAWEDPLQSSRFQNLLENFSSQEDYARLLAFKQPKCGSWLGVIPSPQLGTFLTNESFRIARALRLGCDICQPHKCGGCGAEVTAKGLHGLKCKKSRGRWSRHNAVNDVIARALRTAEVPATTEPLGCSRSNGKRPDGLTLVPWTRRKSMVWDFTCEDTYAPTYVVLCAVNPGSAARVGEELRKRHSNFLQDLFIFIAVAIETSGVWGSEGLRLVKEIGRRITQVTGEPRSTPYLIQQIRLIVQRGNVAAILGSIPEGKKINEIFNF